MLLDLKNQILRKIYRILYKHEVFYSPIPNLKEVKNRSVNSSIDLSDILDLRFNLEEQFALLEILKNYHSEFLFPEHQNESALYFKDNFYFNRSDAFFLFAVIRHFCPKRIIEVGSGFSSALMLDVNRQFFQDTILLTFIEPFPKRLYSLLERVHRQIDILVSNVQDISLDLFETLEKNDILFIDSSHVSKIGSDVNHIFFNILPRLKPGVIIHFHDITWPFDYPMEWISEGRYWTEAYLLRAFLMNNNNYDILLFNNYLAHKHNDWLKINMPHAAEGGGSFYLVKKEAN